MAVEIIMPKLGMSMKEGTIVEWHKAKGESVKKGEPVVSISSEKIENEVEAPADGELIGVSAEVDEVVAVGKPIGFIGEPGEQVPDPESGGAAGETKPEKETAPEQTRQALKPESPPPAAGKKRASPAAKKLARQKGIDIETVVGTGPGGRVTKEDVLQAAEKGTGTEVSPQTVSVPAQTETSQAAGGASSQEPVKKELKGIRKVIADRMHDSIRNTAQLTIMKHADVTKLMAFRKELNTDLATDEESVKVSVTDLLARAVTKALLEHPNMNSALKEGTIYEYGHIHLGIAAANDKGLVVPVLFNVQDQSLKDISAAIRSLGEKARDGSLSSEEMAGSTFTVTNLGASGISFFTPVLNPPETGILGVGATEETLAFSEKGDVVAKKKLPLSLTFDHRVVDGEPASRFLNTVIAYLEHPYRLLI
ncbi:dihydrolipoamide acetyltransferase family protein [Salipaludibacillus aurantiacus]|uniref:Dihydrolipoamide acetyltransferase component of pyruvate dehydrogenase complex n=1 Tax=Salipaludibacillus aurantiacus TaxID=1601833 RepID=A0A1H9TQU7_9BACI|nr:dihydrolipoamide acetyltransferase family protein [Salipaludibacillus aurantiacus]SER99377.1 pyruvate dehydrogenase E2 component (dihydrolipoamide acetyltransferase) [Salipaludibacillus aurantiacus]